MYLSKFPRVRRMIDDFVGAYPMSEFGPGHVLFSDYNVNNGCVYYSLSLIDEALSIPETQRLETNSHHTDVMLLAMREFIKEFLTIEEIVREVSIELDTELICENGEDFVNGFIDVLLITEIEEWTKKIDFSCFNDFDVEYYHFIYNFPLHDERPKYNKEK